MLLSEALDEFELAKVGESSKATQRWYRLRLRSLIEFVGDVVVEAVTTADLRRWRADLLERTCRWADHPTRPETEGGLAPDTVRGYVRAVRTFFTWLVDEEYLDHDPARRVKLPPKGKRGPKDVTPADVLAMLEVADVRDRAIIRFLADTGCRVGGLCSLRLDGLDLERRRAWVIEKGRGGGKVRVLHFGDETAAAVELYLQVRERCVLDGDEEARQRVWWGQKGPLTETGVYQMLGRVAKRAGVKGRFNPHAFRHGWAHGALKNGADLGTVSDVLGHSSIQVTHEFYARWADDGLAERQRRYSWINGEEKTAGDL